MQQRAVIECHEIGGVALEDKVKVTDGLVVVTDLGTQQATVEVGLLAGRVKADGVVVVGHRAEVIVEVILHVGAIDEVARISWLQQDGAIHIGESVLKVMLGACVDLGTHDIGRGVVLAQGYGVVEVLKSRGGVLAGKVHLCQADVGTVIAAVELQQAVKGCLCLVIVL